MFSLTKLVILIVIPIIVAFQPKNDPSGTMTPVKGKAKWIVEKSSTLRVLGKSNVNNFTCDISGYYQPDTFYCEEKIGCEKNIKLRGSLEIDVLDFNCHNKLVTSDLRKTLKAKDHPKIYIRFLTLDRMPSFASKCERVSGLVEIELGGVCKVFQVCYEFVNDGKAPFQMNGIKSFNLSDFHLSPPKKLAGVIRVSDQFQVDFQLRIKPANG